MLALRIRGLVFSLALLGCHGLAFSMDVVQTFKVALEQDAGIRSARAALAASMERLPQARAQLLPSVNLSLSRNTNDLVTTSPSLLGGFQQNRDDYISFNKSLTLRQPLYNMQRLHLYQQSFSLVDEAQFVYEREVQNLSVKVGAYYLDALLSEEQLKVAKAQSRQFSVLVRAARDNFAAGVGTRTDVDEAQARWDMSQAVEMEARQNVVFARRQLEMLVNQPMPELQSVSGSLLLPQMLQTLQEFLDRAFAESPELRAAKARVEAAEKAVAVTQAAHGPTLDAVAQWSDSGSENVTRLNSRYENRVIGVQLSLPLYQGGAVNSQIRQAVAEKVRAQEALEALKRDLELRIFKEYRNVTEGALRVRALEQAVKSAEVALDSTSKSKQAGVRSLLDVLNAEQQLTSAVRDLTQARYWVLLSRLRLFSLAGEDALTNLQHIHQALIS